MITRPHNAHRSTFAVVPLALALTAAAVAAGCDPAIGEIGLHPLPPAALPGPAARSPIPPRRACCGRCSTSSGCRCTS